VASYELNLCKHILPTLGDRPLAAIQRSEVQAWVNATGAALGPNTLRTVYGFVASIFREAVRDRLIAYTPCDRITLPAKVATEVSPLTAEQVMALANAINPRYRALVITGAGTGLRPSELFGLTVDRIDFLRRTIKVDRQLARATAASGAPLFGPPKTESSKRSVPLPQTVTDALAAHLAEYGNGPAGLVFTNTGRGATGFGSSAGRPIRRNAFDEVWRAGVRAAGLPGHTTPHDLRHTYASLLIAANESPKVIQARLGHKDISETFNTYGHLFPTADDSTRSAIDGAFNADAPSTPRQQRGTPTNRQ
jgi:integrase